MAELGSHQLDAASIFISAMYNDGRKVQPLRVAAVGGRHIFPHDRDCEDHVYCTYEFPTPVQVNNNYMPRLDMVGFQPSAKVVVADGPRYFDPEIDVQIDTAAIRSSSRMSQNPLGLTGLNCSSTSPGAMD